MKDLEVLNHLLPPPEQSLPLFSFSSLPLTHTIDITHFYPSLFRPYLGSKKKKYFTSGKLEDTQTKSTKFPQGSVQVRVLSSSGPTVLTYSLPLILVRIPRKNTEHILPTFDAPFPSWSFSRTAQHISYSAQPLLNKWPLNKPSSQISQDRNKTRLRHCSDSMIVKSSGWLASPRYPLLYC